MSKLKILLAEGIHSIAQTKLISEGFQVDSIPHAPSESEYLKLLPQYDVLGIRSKSNLTAEILEKNKHLLTIGAFCIGTNQINLETAAKNGIPVFNAPHSNTRSVAELVICEMIALSRQLADRSQLAHEGEWMKSADGSREIRGKTIGIVGYGHIGSQVSILAESLGMKVIFFDVIKKLPLGNAQTKNKFEELLAESDFVTLHVPENTSTKNMIGRSELELMKKGSYLINASRGTVVVVEDLVHALKNDHLSGCAIDVFPTEPASNKEKFSTPLQGLKNVILTPHIGGSTEEAQLAIGLEVAESFRKFLQQGTTAWSVNFPQIEMLAKKNVTRILNVHHNAPGVLSELNSYISAAGANIQAQFLSTNSDIGYMVVDLEMDQSLISSEQLVSVIQKSNKSVKTRLVI